jgi:hypothetical protein
MGAVICVLNESLTESIRGFYKLRKAYITLDGILAAERAYIEKNGSKSKSTSSVGTLSDESSDANISTPATEESETTVANEKDTKEEKDEVDDDFVDADEAHDEMPTPSEYLGHVEDNEGKLHDTVAEASPEETKSNNADTKRPIRELMRSTTNLTVKEGPDVDLFGDHPIDTFIHSGSNLSLGILSLIISMIPPAFATLLKIVGFKGDRDKGFEMLWQASKVHNIFGGFAGLVLLGFYNGLVGFCDIIPDKGQGSYPKERCHALLAEMRRRYPESQLWLLEEVRMLACEKRLEEAVKLMSDARPSQLRQVEALQCFEKSLDCMYMHAYEETSASFQKVSSIPTESMSSPRNTNGLIQCVTLNNWSHGLYYYIAGCCHVELYRKHKTADQDEAVSNLILSPLDHF